MGASRDCSGCNTSSTIATNISLDLVCTDCTSTLLFDTQVCLNLFKWEISGELRHNLCQLKKDTIRKGHRVDRFHCKLAEHKTSILDKKQWLKETM